MAEVVAKYVKPSSSNRAVCDKPHAGNGGRGFVPLEPLKDSQGAVIYVRKTMEDDELWIDRYE